MSSRQQPPPIYPDADAMDPTRKRLNFDPTVNLGHVLTFAGFMATIFAGWSTLDKRLTVTETRAAVVEQRVAEQENRIKESLGELKSDVRDIKRSVEDLARASGKAR